jgi:hypothetical protein
MTASFLPLHILYMFSPLITDFTITVDDGMLALYDQSVSAFYENIFNYFYRYHPVTIGDMKQNIQIVVNCKSLISSAENSICMQMCDPVDH